jgi:hypothetical protein
VSVAAKFRRARKRTRPSRALSPRGFHADLRPHANPRSHADQARQIDPAGEGTPQVQRLRNAVKVEPSLER